ncbi:MAG: hypothetical protein ALECFALPRED_003548 [Alectoria fallacina]|uniref:F-box domain-containing protein n=1 Tax=Alectoria fallacina TaxID=1903189 RepID=A0A8H3EL81_9LECA|nr:MAG: hypothetical protein ALECFALPRED_003548 [Alectoria fallacina]
MAHSHVAVDVFGKLPLELSQHIFQYLQLYQIFQARRVSRRWNAVLSSSHIVESMVLRPWYTEEKSPLQIPEGLSESAVLSLKAEHVDAFRNGTPFSIAVAKTESWYDGFASGPVEYSEGVLAWLTTGDKSIHLKWLASERSATLTPPDEGIVGDFILDGSCLVAFTLSRICYVWRLPDGVQAVEVLAPKSFISYSLRVMSMIASDSRLVILYEDDHEKVHLTTMDIETGTMHHFKIRLKGSNETPFDFNITITREDKSIVFFERFLGNPSYVYFTRVTASGEVESQGHIKHPDISNYSRHSESRMPSPPVNGGVVLWSYIRHIPSYLNAIPDTWLLLRIVFNSDQDRLEVEEQTISHIGKTPPGTADDMIWWKDVAYMKNHLIEQGKPEVMDLRESICMPAEMSLLGLPEPHSISPSIDEEEEQSFLLGDEIFLISIRRDTCVVWCFDKHVDIHLVDPFSRGRCYKMGARGKIL